ncbi:MFS-type transporter SLC18B1-like isoform X3 [Symsagittifera roscoffensis]|uniref:MFS-type transporter SLC18B1-like isoform X3 n=1 Tax=Symsagittifera roscoffensis TaxID=84072 RepID=UPI00307C4105
MNKCRQIWLFFLLFIAMTLDAMHFSMAAPFFPTNAKAKGVSHALIGFINACDAVSFGLAALLVTIMPTHNYMKSLYCSGLAVFAVCFCLFGLMGLRSEGDWIYVSVLAVNNAILGAVSGVVFVVVVPLVSGIIPNSFTTVVSIIQASLGLGFALGPALGSLLYELGGFALPFLFIGISMGIVAVFSIISLQSIRDATTDPVEGGEQSLETSPEPDDMNDVSTSPIGDTNCISFIWFLRNLNFWKISLCIINAFSLFGFRDTFMALFMQTEMGISNDSTIAHIFLAAAGGWIFSVLLVGFLCKHNLGGEYLQTYSGTVFFVTLASPPFVVFLIVLSSYFEQLQNVWWAGVLLLLINFIQAGVAAPGLLVLKRNAINDMGTERQSNLNEVNNSRIELLASGMFQVMRSIGRAVGMFIFGGFVVDLVDEKRAVLVYLTTSLLLSIINIAFFVTKPKIWKSN